MKWALRISALVSFFLVVSKLSNTSAFEHISVFYYEFSTFKVLIVLITGFIWSFLNWSLESLKWLMLFRGKETNSLVSMFKYNLSSFALAYNTPARVGVYPILPLLFPNTPKYTLWLRKYLCDFSQQTATWIFAMLGLFCTSVGMKWIDELLVVLIPLGVIFYIIMLLSKVGPRIARWVRIPSSLNLSSRLKILSISILRYLVFSSLMLFFLFIFDVTQLDLQAYGRVTLYFWISSFIPRFFLSDLIGRQSIAMVLFPSSLATVAMVVFVLWFFNSLIPILLGLKYSKELKLI